MQVEQLEGRWCPSTTPVLSYTLKNTSDPTVSVLGHVTSDNSGTSTVVFTGAISKTVVTDSNGYFSFTVTPDYRGVVSAIGWDHLNYQTNVQKSLVLQLPPTFTSFTASLGANSVWTFQGNVSDVDPRSVRIVFEGLACLNNASTGCDGAGNFCFSFAAPADSSATIMATATNSFGLSATAFTTIQPTT